MVAYILGRVKVGTFLHLICCWFSNEVFLGSINILFWMELFGPANFAEGEWSTELDKAFAWRLSKPPHNYIPVSGLGHIITYFLIEQISCCSSSHFFVGCHYWIFTLRVFFTHYTFRCNASLFKKNLKVAGLQGGLAESCTGVGGRGEGADSCMWVIMSGRSAEFGGSS